MMSQKSNKSKHSQFLVYALQNGKLVHITEVENGIKSNCFCPTCNSQLIAKNKGLIKMAHFAHSNKQECKYAAQTALHLAAKEILSKAKFIQLPECNIFINQPTTSMYNWDFHPKGYQLLYNKEDRLEFDEVILEKKLHSFIPDVIIIKKGVKLIIEIAVTHFVGREKLKEIESSNISAIEIDLSEIDSNFSRENLNNLIIDSVVHKTWLFNRKAKEEKAKVEKEEFEKFQHQLALDKQLALEAEEKKKITEEWYKNFYKPIKYRETSQRTVLHVMDCPEKKREYYSEFYANVDADCKVCTHFRGTRINREYVVCLFDYHSNKQMPSIEPS